MHVEVGIRAAVTVVVGESDTAIALGSGDVPVLGTPRVIALCEQACVAALVGHLTPEQTTVGVKVQLDHLQPTAVGASVTAEAVLERSEGRRLMFHVKVEDHRGMVATGFVTRVVVDAERFLHKIS